MLKDYEEQRLRKRLLSALRQNGEQPLLYFDTYGYTPVNALLAYIRTLKGCSGVTLNDIRQVVDHDPEHRIDWDGGALIRATYGFLPGPKKWGEEVEPPPQLFYGTHRKLIPQIAEGGLLPIANEHVQLAASPADIGEEQGTLVLLAVSAHDAWQQKIRFYQGSERYFFAEAIPAAYLSASVLPERR
ncbi:MULTISPECIES: RNA 2'-phosphotransferase [Brevibacillus]|jgi:putative RNA 2'-phosphotransferase|uniref:RNA 2'-phosphotransferase n=1 Tax=Brevibacillus TaxID=55080 RepID=UPI00046911B3|nr:RNA 2'-phosphotransferase [Brevibacillus borstelensis]KKX54153.1 RNA 2'-phosphotransferase [Brevibacillus borstelensis cifa_chp40]MBE5398186.1 RNA 2'-phosphotransferase [Brevibacillus borstelensis]MCC0564317.1 RNA 2'-phosphotransferase [Brevibacillus borstelensis]MCM3472406.1 RNA 2'-phosphotransferase [Brevibacillus borstelensis]MCM3559445.1 RNA 2'-phosphotransferase [Brevibacillus borstelensis]